MHYQFQCACIKGLIATHTVQCDKKFSELNRAEMDQGIINALQQQIRRLRVENYDLQEALTNLQMDYQIMGFVYYNFHAVLFFST